MRYRKYSEYQTTDIKELRPKDSYKNLILKRTHTIDGLIKKYGRIPADLLVKRDCPICKSQDYSNVLNKDYLTIVKCNKCNMVYTNPIFDEEHYLKAYSSVDYQNIVKELGEKSHEYRVKRFGDERVSYLKNHLKEVQNIKHLDIGCSTGFVVEAAANEGWDSLGIDLNPSAIEFGRKRGLNLKNTSLEELDTEIGNYNVITLFDVLEHIHDPLILIKECTKLLAKNGLIYVYVPNWDSASRLLMGEDAHFIWPTHHLNYFNIETISKFFKRLDYIELDVYTEGLDIVDYIWREEEINKSNCNSIRNIENLLQFFINAGGYGKNLRFLCQKK